jgi:ABC-type transport system involved in multi-copper enzyme maturation permease subunit
MTAPSLSSLSSLPPAAVRAGFGGALRSEWTKIRSLRSTVWTLGSAIVVTVGLGTAINWGNAGGTHETAQQLAADDLTQSTLAAIVLSQLIMVVFGALAITSEYSTGMIRTVLSVQPRRASVFWAKLLTVTAVAFVVGEAMSFASFLLGSIFWRHKGVPLNLGSPHVTQAVIGGGLYLAGTAMLAFGLGAILRNTAGAITTGSGMLFVISILASFLPKSWGDHLTKWLPFNAGSRIWSTKHDGANLSPWPGFAVFMIYGTVAVAVGWFLFRRRDA